MSFNSPIRRWWDWSAALLIMAAMLTAASRLVATQWTINLSLVQSVAFFGVVAGLALGLSRFSGRIVGLIATVYGLFIVGWQLGSTVKDDPPWAERLLSLLSRLGLILYQLINRQTVYDSLLFIVLMCLLFWLLASSAGYVLVRHCDPWKAIVPTGLALFVIHFYDPLVARRTWYLAFFIFFGLVLVARMAFIQQQSQWKESRTSLPPHLSLDFIRFTLLFAGLIVLFSWTAPALANALPIAERLWRPVRGAWNNAMEDMNYAFASLRSTMPVFSPVYGNNAVLGHGTLLTDTQIFIARAPADVPAGVRFYWRARTFDQYDNGQWFSNIDTNYNYDPENTELTIPQGVGRWIGEFDVTSAATMGTIFTPPQPFWVDRPGQVQYAANPDGTVDISSFISSPPVIPGEIYRVNASLSSPTVEQLRSTGTDYPAFITERYLQLPETITPRTRQLAQEITAGAETQYDKVNAITNWLRKNITYVEVIEADQPQDQEPMDWFLFDLKQGFCNYYSTAEIVLLRSLGIPARWSVGYAQGEQISDETLENIRDDLLTYSVRHKDAHAWPEVYFSTIGWVEFEPTVGQPDIIRLETSDITNPGLMNPGPSVYPDEGPQDSGDGLIDDPEATSNVKQPNWLTVVYWIAAVLAGIGLLLVAALRVFPVFGIPAGPILLETAIVRSGRRAPKIVEQWARKVEKIPRKTVQLPPLPVTLEAVLIKIGIRPPQVIRRWSHYAQLPPLSRSYTEINRSLGRIGLEPAADLTPAERATALGSALPPAESPAQRLVQEYQIGTFSRLPANLEIARQSANELRKISWYAVFQRILSRFQAPTEERQFVYRQKR